ncbi:MAG: peptidoglycan editing factor PgeF [Gammaproteobacteria bacterium]|nr:peptidoglycan editing factor PgeF [Gammaproteobacteria bacterium]MDX2458955.1 peptidoglycan editing factor PgeF [Gammaproteobacteria bacterium]
MMGDVEALTSDILSRRGGLRHGFFTRRGGVSVGIYRSLNCGPGSADDSAHVSENRARVMAALGYPAGGLQQLNTLAQIHSAEVVSLREALPMGQHPKADALVTDVPGLVIGVLAADCVPVLFADTAGTVVAAAHAGWKGALGGVVAATVAAMGEMGAPAERIVACVGPCIQQQSYEVGAPMRQQFLDADAGNIKYFEDAERSGHFMFDLSKYVTDRVEAAGVAGVERLPLDTYTLEQDFFSYRRATHRQESDYGRQVSAIALSSN